MIGFIKSILSIIITLCSFVINSLTSIIRLFANIPTYMVYITQLINLLPSFVLPFAFGYVSLAIVLFVLNRRS